MKLIVLHGPENSGKTSTLEVVYERLKRISVSEPYFEYVDVLRDFNAVLEIDKKKIRQLKCDLCSPIRVGIVTQGDYVKGANSVYNHLEKMLKEKCDIVFCACSEKNTRKVQPKNKIVKFVDTNKSNVEDPIYKAQRIICYSVQDLLNIFINIC